MLDLEPVVVLFDLRAELYFFEVRDVLLPLRLLLLLVLLVLEFSEVHHAANRRLGGGRNLDQVQLTLLGVSERFSDAQDSYLLAVRPDDADRRNPDAIIDPDFLGCGDSPLPPLVGAWKSCGRRVRGSGEGRRGDAIAPYPSACSQGFRDGASPYEPR